MLQTQMDAGRFVELYEATLDDVYRYASRLTGGDRVRTDELVQETYLGVMRRLRSGHTVEVTTSYLIVACRNRFLDQLRSDRRRRRREERAAASDVEPRPIDPAELDGDRAVAALRTLTDDQRIALSRTGGPTCRRGVGQPRSDRRQPGERRPRRQLSRGRRCRGRLRQRSDRLLTSECVGHHPHVKQVWT